MLARQALDQLSYTTSPLTLSTPFGLLGKELQPVYASMSVLYLAIEGCTNQSIFVKHLLCAGFSAGCNILWHTKQTASSQSVK